MPPDPKGGKRVVDKRAVKVALLRYPRCACCGKRASNAHHVVQKGSPHFGDDVVENIVGLCGTGTMGCHGAFHGNPYEIVKPDGSKFRYTTEYVSRMIGDEILHNRPDVIRYVLAKLGFDAGAVFLERTYYLYPTG